MALRKPASSLSVPHVVKVRAPSAPSSVAAPPVRNPAQPASATGAAAAVAPRKPRLVKLMVFSSPFLRRRNARHTVATAAKGPARSSRRRGPVRAQSAEPARPPA